MSAPKVYGQRFAVVPDAVLYAAVSTNAKVLWAILARHADPMGHCYPGRNRLAQLLGCSPNTVSRAKAELVKAKLIECHSRYDDQGRRTSDDVMVLGGAHTTSGTPLTTGGDTGITMDGETEVDPEGSNPTPYGVGSGVTTGAAPNNGGVPDPDPDLLARIAEDEAHIAEFRLVAKERIGAFRQAMRWAEP